MFSQYTSYLANRLCGGSSRKLIAGWWYSILALTAGLAVVSVHDGVAAAAAFLLCGYGIGGTMILRKFHSSLAVGFFMGVTVAAAQLFFALALLHWNVRHVQRHNNEAAKEVTWLASLSLVQGVLLGSFAAILAAHRTEILLEDSAVAKPTSPGSSVGDVDYEPPARA
jgi:hypothetical protein